MTNAADPVAAAQAWIEAAVRDRDWPQAWTLTDPALRLAGAQDWVFKNSGHATLRGFARDELAQALAAAHPTHELWPMFAALQLRQTLSLYWDGFDLNQWHAISPPRPVGPDLELVEFEMSNSGTRRPLIAHRSDGGWLIAAVGDQLLEPGWPPRWGRRLS